MKAVKAWAIVWKDDNCPYGQFDIYKTKERAVEHLGAMLKVVRVEIREIKAKEEGEAVTKPNETPRCRGSVIEPSNHIIVGMEVHSGAVIHKCKLLEGDHLSCECECGHRWIKNFKGLRP